MYSRALITPSSVVTMKESWPSRPKKKSAFEMAAFCLPFERMMSLKGSSYSIE